MKAGRDTPRAVRDADHREKMLEKIKRRRFDLGGQQVALLGEHLNVRVARAQRALERARA